MIYFRTLIRVILCVHLLALTGSARLYDDPSEIKLDGSELKVKNLQDPETGLGAWAEPESLLGGVREVIWETCSQDADMRAWFCEVDEKIKSGEIDLGSYENPGSGKPAGDTAGFADGDTAAIEEASVSDLRKAGEREIERTTGSLAEILVHELTHVSQAQDGVSCAAPADGDSGESSECACEHAGAYAKQLKFLILYREMICIDNESYPGFMGDFFVSHYEQTYAKWVAAHEACNAGEEAGEHESSPSGPSIEDLTKGDEYTDLDCDDFSLKDDGEGGWTGWSDPDEDGDGDPCTEASSEEAE